MLVDPGGGSFVGISNAVSGITAAVSAGFTISEGGGQPLLDAIQELQDEIQSALVKASQLELEPKLGTTPAATVYKPFLATVASDPTQGAIPVLKKLQTDLTDAQTAIRKSMDNYNRTEDQASSAINGTLT
jgi:hypothetical protein